MAAANVINLTDYRKSKLANVPVQPEDNWRWPSAAVAFVPVWFVPVWMPFGPAGYGQS